MSLLLWGDDAAKGADISFNGPMLGMPYSLARLGFTYTRNSPKSVYQNNALVTLAANQFGTTYDSVTGLHAFEPEPAATNLALNSILAGGGAAPTSWAQNFGTGSSAPVASLFGAASGAIAYLQSATAQRPFFSQTCSVSASTTYVFTALIESRSGTLTASDAMVMGSIPAGATVTYPVCSANPAGGSAGVLGTGELKVQISIAATAGTVSARIGLGCNANITGTLQFSRPQFETGVRRTSWIATTTGTVTRAADVLSCAVANIPGFSAAGYTLVVDGRKDVPNSGAFTAFIEVNAGNANNRSGIAASTTNLAQTYSVSAAAAQSDISATALGTTRNKIAYSVALNSMLRAVNGVAGTADLIGVMPVGLTTLNVGCRFAGQDQTNGYIYGFKLIPVALNQEQTTGQTS